MLKRLMGKMTAMYFQPRGLHELVFLAGVAKRTALAMVALKTRESLFNEATHDPLTGLYNRRGFVEHARQLLRSATRANRSACVFFVDLNDMKGINDSLGHEFGDRALTSAARVLSLVFRDSDIVSRLGGDEFAVFASECGAADIAALRERLRARTGELNAAKNEPFELSMSVGAAVFEPGSKADLDTLMERADQSMYEEKRALHRAGD